MLEEKSQKESKGIIKNLSISCGSFRGDLLFRCAWGKI
jgi:hypothetical protein